MPDESDNSTIKEVKAEKARRRWLGRWLLKLMGWFFALSIAVVLIIGIVATIAWYNLTAVANFVVARFVAPYRIELGKVDVSTRGLVHLETVRFLPPQSLAAEGDAPWVNLDGVDLTYDLAELRNEMRFRTVTLRNPVIRIDDGSLELLGKRAGSPPGQTDLATAGIPDLGFLGKIADRVEVTGGRLEIDISQAPPITTEWDLSVPAVDFGDEEWLNREPLALRLSKLSLGEKGALGTIERLEVRGRMRSDLNGIEIAEFAVTSPRLIISPEWGRAAAPESEAAATNDALIDEAVAAALEESVGMKNEAFEVLVGAFRINRGEISLRGFDGKGNRGSLPNLDFATTIDWRDLRFAGGNLSAGGPLTLTLKDLIVDGWSGNRADQPPTARIGELSVKFDPADLFARHRIESMKVTEPLLFVSPDSTARFFPGKPDGAGASPAAFTESKKEPESSESTDWSLGSFILRGGSVDARDWRWKERELPATRFDWGVELTELSPALFDQETPLTGGDPEQQLELENFRLNSDSEATPSTGPEDDAMISIEKLTTRFRIGALLRNHRIDSLNVARPLFDITDERLPAWLAEFEAETDSSPEVERPTAPIDSPAVAKPDSPFSVGDLAIEDGVIRLDTVAMKGRLPKLQGTFSLVSRDDDSVDASGETNPYRMHFGRLRIRSRQGAVMPGSESKSENDAADAEVAVTEALGGLFPQDPDPDDSEQAQGASGRVGAIRERDVAFIRDLTIDFSAEGLQRDHQVDRIEVKGAELQVGKGLQQMVDGTGDEKAPTPETELEKQEAPKTEPEVRAEAATPDDENAGAWRVGEFVVTESQVRFESMIPQIEGLEFAIETKLENIPLSEALLLKHDGKQKVELAGIEIRDPYDSFITVALLPTIFVEFTFAGLVNQRVDKIDLISPSIYVGQGLFWWIDYQRNYRKQNEGAGFGLEGNREANADDSVAVATTEAEGVDWEIRQINAHFGKIVVAPTGRPIGIVPFPFHASTNMNNGEIAFKLDIPKAQQYVYRFPDLELDMFGLEGKIEFNVPIKQESNNLVQTFKLERAVWKQYEVEKLYLTVTYDTNGIYGRFGGNGYNGYAEGQFNIYLNDVGVWDAWLAGTGMDMEPITNVIAPDNFIMAGKINAKLVSEGRGLLFGETWGEIEALSPGRIDFTKANEFLANLPEEWSSLRRSATQLSLESLKDFEYETGRGDLYFMNRDGWLRLDLEGETGSRVLEMYAHDWRENQGKGADEADKAAPPDAGVKVEIVAKDDPPKEKLVESSGAESPRRKQFRLGPGPGRR